MPSSESTKASAKRKADKSPSSQKEAKKAKMTAPFPGKISKNLTLAQLREEAEGRGMDLGNVKHDKGYLLGLLGDGSVSVVALNRKQKCGASSQSKKSTANANGKVSKSVKNVDASKAKSASTKKGNGSSTNNTKKAATKAKTNASKATSAASNGKASNSCAKYAAKPPSAKVPYKSVDASKAKSASTKKGNGSSTNSARKAATKAKATASKATSAASNGKASKSCAKSAAKPPSAKVPSSNTSEKVDKASKSTPNKKAPTTQPLITSYTSPISAAKSSSKKSMPSAVESSTAVKAAQSSKPGPAGSGSGPSKKPAASAIRKGAAVAAKKRAITSATHDDEYPRISGKLTQAQLKEEAIARQLDPMSLPKLKADLLHYLVEGSIHVMKTKEYSNYKKLLELLDREKPTLFQASLVKKQATEARKEQLRQQKYEKEEKKRQEEEQRRLRMREEEKSGQKALHTHSFPNVHRHALAESCKLLVNGKPRTDSGRCDICGEGRRMLSFAGWTNPSAVRYTCEICDWDICHECFLAENKSEAEKNGIRMERQRKAEAERLRWEEEERQREEEERRRWDARSRFKEAIMKPPEKNRNSSSPLMFTVWCSDGYDNDGWHGWEGEPTKEFDTCWKTKKEANERSEYLFFWKNPWGIEPTEVSDDYEGEPSPSEQNGLLKWTVSPPDSTRWTVGVVPSQAFPHLENVSLDRHNYDDERVTDNCYSDDEVRSQTLL